MGEKMIIEKIGIENYCGTFSKYLGDVTLQVGNNTHVVGYCYGMVSSVPTGLAPSTSTRPRSGTITIQDQAKIAKQYRVQSQKPKRELFGDGRRRITNFHFDQMRTQPSRGRDHGKPKARRRLPTIRG